MTLKQICNEFGIEHHEEDNLQEVFEEMFERGYLTKVIDFNKRMIYWRLGR